MGLYSSFFISCRTLEKWYKDQVVAVFGCATSSSRKAVLPIFESRNHQLWTPTSYETPECSKNIFYLGAAANQQIEPTLDWLLKNKGKKFFLVGSDYIYPRTVISIIKEQLKLKGGGQLLLGIPLIIH